MEGFRRLRKLSLRNVLSFGPEGQSLDFEPLTVLIGPNGSGKSNLIDVLGLLRSLPNDLSQVIAGAGGVKNWIWSSKEPGTSAEIESHWDDSSGLKPLKHRMVLGKTKGKPEFAEEVIQLGDWPVPEYRFQSLDKTVFTGPDLFDHVGNIKVVMDTEAFRTDQSILSQRKDPERYPFLFFLGRWLSGIRLYRDWVFGRGAPARALKSAFLPDEFLEEEAENLSLVIKRLLGSPGARAKIIESLRVLYEGVSSIRVKESSDFVQIELTEDDQLSIPANRLSDGTLRFLSLLAILCDPTPPPLVCIEEPELGLHPDIIETVAKLLIEASSRTQLIVTTHSADLVSALGEVPESVVVCERGINGTTLKRLEPEKLGNWLKRYTLGHLWSMGEIGETAGERDPSLHRRRGARKSGRNDSSDGGGTSSSVRSKRRPG